jgi:hypothetical protein
VVFYLHIGTDPTLWTVDQERAIGEVAQELAQATTPVVLPLKFPLIGTLVLSVRSAGAVAPYTAPSGSHPSGAKLPTALIRVPSGAAATAEAPGGYSLAPGTGLAQLEQDIIAAMTGGTSLTVPVTSVPGVVSAPGAATTPDGASFIDAALVLNGASLAYAVLCPAG